MRLHYNLWFLLFILLSIPFFPVQRIDFSQIFLRLDSLFFNFPSETPSTLQTTTHTPVTDTLNHINDFAVSVTEQTPSHLNIILLTIWLIGVLFLSVRLIRSYLCFYQFEKSALPLQNEQVWEVFHECMAELNIKRKISVYSTAFLKSPVMTGFIKPKIYLPIHIISDFDKTSMRYMLLHELQHYRHKDSVVNYFSNVFGILYWFNPFVWYARKQMYIEREIACDSSVLQILKEEDYKDYGQTLINFAEKISVSPFPFAAGIGGTMKQMECRILNIANFRPQTFSQKVRGLCIYALTAALLLGLTPVLSTYASEQNHYSFDETDKTISYIDLSSEFKGYDGCFVLYDTKKDTWKIYNKKAALERITPNSTYKIYDALLGLETGIITPETSDMSWDGKNYPFDSWETNQNLDSAMRNSVNWYFQKIDKQAGQASVHSFLHKIKYGNQKIGNSLELYWTDSTLKISAIEQVELLKKFNNNDFQFDTSNITAVKDAICLSKNSSGFLYGKTGTGRVNGQDVNGWFIGYIEKDNHVYYFATNIRGDKDTTGSKAEEITMSILQSGTGYF